MNLLFTIIVTFFAGMGAGLGTGFAGMSAAAVISPMLITFLGMDPYMDRKYKQHYHIPKHNGLHFHKKQTNQSRS